MVLWFFDSMNSECLNINNTWGCVHPDVIQWYINESQEINRMNERIVKGLAFLHIQIGRAHV